jgi:hypothetical protein
LENRGTIHTDGFDVVTNIFSDFEFEDLRSQLRMSTYLPFPLDKPQILYLTPVPKAYDEVLTQVAELTVQSKLNQLRSFARLNTEELDTNFRVHSDGKIYGHYPDVACVFYIDTREDSGTAFFESPIYGRTSPSPEYNVHKVDDGNWHPYAKVHQVANSMLVYNAQLYHGRFPWKSYGVSKEDGRIVIVKFLKTIPGAF